MDPGVGRFTSRDTFSGTITDPISLHPYLYTEDDPVDQTDPSGHNVLSQYNGLFLFVISNVYKTIAINISQLLSELTQTGKYFAILLTDENSSIYAKTPSKLSIAMNAMVACVYNREAYPKAFEAKGRSVSDILTAPGQFAEFTSSGPKAYFKKKFQNKLLEAESGDPRHYALVQEALNVSDLAEFGVYQDPFLSQGGTYGWKTAGPKHLPLGRNFKQLRTLAGNKFYTLTKNFLVSLSPRSSLALPSPVSSNSLLP
jgi:hypothetical protein